MNIRKLIESLEELAQEHGDKTEVRIAEQPSWPFENEIQRVEVANLNTETCEVCDGEGYDEDNDSDCENCGGTGTYRKNDNKGDEWVVYLGEGHQIGYLPQAAAQALDWRGK